MTSARQNKGWNSRRNLTKRNTIGSVPLATSVNTSSTASAISVQQASPVDQSSELPATLPNKNNASLEEQIKQHQLLIDKLTNRINALLFEVKVAIQEKVNNLLEQKTDDLEAYSRRPFAILSWIQKSKEETRENIKISVLENLQNTGLEEIEWNIDNIYRVGRFDH